MTESEIAQIALELYKNINDSDGFEHKQYYQCVDEVKKAHEVKENSFIWHSVEDCLPKSDDYVIVRCINSDSEYGWKCHWFFKSYYKNSWHINEEDSNTFEEDSNTFQVTHWLEIPEFSWGIKFKDINKVNNEITPVFVDGGLMTQDLKNELKQEYYRGFSDGAKRGKKIAEIEYSIKIQSSGANYINKPVGEL